MIPKISLESQITKSSTSNCINNQITINASGSSPQASPQQDAVTMRDAAPQMVYPTINSYADIPNTPVEVPGIEIQGLLKENIMLKCDNLAYQIVFSMMKENPLYINSLIIVDDIKLIALLKLMCEADEVTLDLSDDLGCCTFEKYRIVNTIYIKKDNKILNLKYDFPYVTKQLKEFGINTKFVF
jgi:hypothetical protein